MGRKTYSDWVPEVDQRPNSNQALLDLEADYKCRGAAADLFWRIEFHLDRLQHLDRVRSDFLNMQLLLQEDYGMHSEVEVTVGELRHIAEQLNMPEGMLRRMAEWLNMSEGEHRAAMVKRLNPFLNRIHDLVRNIQSSSRELASRLKDEWEASAFVQLHLVTILLRAIRKEMWGSLDLVDELVDIGEKAFELTLPDEDKWLFWTESKIYDIEALLREQGVDFESPGGATAHEETSPTEEQRRKSLWGVSAMFYNEAFKVKFDSGADEEALTCFAKACRLWQESGSGLSGELNLVEAGNCFERLRLTRSAVSSWKTVAESCNLIRDSLEIFPESEDLKTDLEILDRQKRPWVALAYWQYAATLAESEMSPTEFKKVLDSRKEGEISERIKLDFLEEDYELLEGDSLKALIEMEDTWYNAPLRGGRREAAVNELRLVFEHEVDAAVFRQIRKSIDNVLANGEKKRKLHLNSRPGGKLSLQDMATLLELAGNKHALEGLAVRRYIESLPLSSSDTNFLVSELPAYLHKLARARAKPEHREKVLLETIKGLRRTALGISEPSYLRNLLNIKKIVRQKSRH